MRIYLIPIEGTAEADTIINEGITAIIMMAIMTAITAITTIIIIGTTGMTSASIQEILHLRLAHWQLCAARTAGGSRSLGRDSAATAALHLQQPALHSEDVLTAQAKSRITTDSVHPAGPAADRPAQEPGGRLGLRTVNN